MKNFEIDFNNELMNVQAVSFYSNYENLILILNNYDGTLIKFEFIDCIFFFIDDEFHIKKFKKVNDSVAFKMSLVKVYENIPAEHPYKSFQFLNENSECVAEVISANVILTE